MSYGDSSYAASSYGEAASSSAGGLTGTGVLTTVGTAGSGSGPVGLSGTGGLVTPGAVGFAGSLGSTGSGDLSASGYLASNYTASGGLTGSGVIVAEGEAFENPQLYMQLALVSSSLTQAPTAVVASVTDGWPGDDVQFSLDGTPVLTTVLNVDGALLRSIEVPGTFAAGTHTLSVASLTGQPGWSTSADFTLAQNPQAPAAVVAADPPTAVVAGADTGTGVLRWVFQDVAPGGLGSYVLPKNPRTMTSPEWRRTLSNERSTSVEGGRYHFYEGNPPAVQWSWTGFLDSEAEYLALKAYADLDRRIYVLDHRGRGWKVAITDFDARPRKRQHNTDGSFNDWAHDYTMSALILDRQWAEPV